MLSKLKNVWYDVRQGENIDLYLTVLSAVALAILNLVGIGQSWVASVTLAVLALIAVSLLVNRHKMETLLEKLNKSTGEVLLNRFPVGIEDDIHKSGELWMVGVVLTRTILTYYSLLQEKLKRGDSIRILVVDPNGVANDIVASRAYRSMSSEESRNQILFSLSNMCALKGISPSRLEIRIIDYPLSFGFLAADLDSQNGIIYSEHYAFKVGQDMPVIVLRPQDQEWYRFFKQQIMTLWNNAAEWYCKDKAREQP